MAFWELFIFAPGDELKIRADILRAVMALCGLKYAILRSVIGCPAIKRAEGASRRTPSPDPKSR